MNFRFHLMVFNEGPLGDPKRPNRPIRALPNVHVHRKDGGWIQSASTTPFGVWKACKWSRTVFVFPSRHLFWRFPGLGKSAAVCFGVSRAAESPPSFVLVFPGPRNFTNILFWRFPSLGILQKFCFGVFRASEFYKSFVLTFSEPWNLTHVMFWRFPNFGI